MTASFVSTAIPYVNARPHLGFAYELVLADVLARHRRRRGQEVWFSTGTDDNSLKNVQAAASEGVPIRELVARNAAAFRDLGSLLDISADDFVSTSTDPRHRTTVESLWRACRADLERGPWRGRYCVGCEAFIDADLCEEHRIAPELIEEENWFFRLSRWRSSVREAIASGRVEIIPEAARNETLAFLDGEVSDISVSRVASRSGGWGIPVPDDPAQVIYVWFDALVNYLSALDGRLEHWRDSTHVIGKGITRFHAVYWLAFLLSAGLPLPSRIFVHGYLTIDGKKISKSGRSVEVAPVVARVGSDALRWYYARRCRPRVDSDLSIEGIEAAFDNDLVGGLGNLVQRCTVLAAKLGVVPAVGPGELQAVAEALPARIDAALARFAVDDAAAAIVEVIDAANRAVDRTAPWKLDAVAAARALYPPLEAARIVAGELSPFAPGVARVIGARLGGDATPGWGRLGAVVTGPPPLARLRVIR